MTSGIYKIHFDNMHEVYIGQSINIERRWKDHLRTLRANTHHNYKLQSAFNVCGAPHFEVIEVVDCIANLNNRESYWISKYSSYISGLNLTPGGSSCIGECNPSSKYSDALVIEAAEYLVSEANYTLPEISSLTGVSVPVLQNISCLASHIWLKDKRPDIWDALVEINKLGRKFIKFKNSETALKLASPDGTIYEFYNQNEFAKEHDLIPQSLGQVLSGKREHHKGWTLPGTVLSRKVFKLVSPDGTTYEFYNQSKFAREHSLSNSHISKVLSGKAKQHKGWTKPKD